MKDSWTPGSFFWERTGADRFMTGTRLRVDAAGLTAFFFYGGVALRLFKRLFINYFGFLARQQGHRSGPFLGSSSRPENNILTFTR